MSHLYEKDFELGAQVETIEFQDENYTVRGGDTGTIVEALDREVRVEFENGETLYLPRYLLKVKD